MRSILLLVCLIGCTEPEYQTDASVSSSTGLTELLDLASVVVLAGEPVFDTATWVCKLQSGDRVRFSLPLTEGQVLTGVKIRWTGTEDSDLTIRVHTQFDGELTPQVIDTQNVGLGVPVTKVVQMPTFPDLVESDVPTLVTIDNVGRNGSLATITSVAFSSDLPPWSIDEQPQ